MSRRDAARPVGALPVPGRASRAKPATQVAALCLDATGAQLLLITSRDTGRWVLPKGWPMRKRSLAATALREAWEEAGVEGRVGRAEIGRYHYDKRRDHGFAVPVEVRVFGVAVRRLADRYPEAGQRQRRWAAPAEAAGLVAEEGLQSLILCLPDMVRGGLLQRLVRGR